MSNELSDRDVLVIATIGKIRDEYHACTGAEVAARLKMSRTYMHEVMHDMVGRGLVAFNAEMPGSVRVVADATTETKPELEAKQCECGWPTAQALAMHQRKHG